MHITSSWSAGRFWTAHALVRNFSFGLAVKILTNTLVKTKSKQLEH